MQRTQDVEVEQTITILEHDALFVRGNANVARNLPDDPKDEVSDSVRPSKSEENHHP